MVSLGECACFYVIPVAAIEDYRFWFFWNEMMRLCKSSVSGVLPIVAINIANRGFGFLLK